MAEQLKIGIVGASFDTDNMGVGALAAGTVSSILHVYPQAAVFFLNYEKFSAVYSIQVAGNEVAIPLVNMRFSWKVWLRNNIGFLLFLTVLMKLFPFPYLRRRWIAANDCLRHLDESDLVMAISGGDSFSDIYGLVRLLYVSLPQILALWSGKRLILLPQTIGPFKSRLAQTIASYIMRRAELVYSRDHAGVRLATQVLGLNASTGKVRFCYDVGFALDPMAPQRMDVVGLEFPRSGASGVVGLNVSGLLLMGGYTGRNMFGLKIEYSKLIYDLIDFMIQQKNSRVLLIPHVFGQCNESDATVSARFYEALKHKYPGRIGWVRGNYNQSEIKHVIGTCDFFIGARMHACIAAASQNVPVVPMAYSDKFVGVMQTIGIEANVVDLRTMNEEESFKVIDRALEHGAQIGQHLARTMPHVKESVLSVFEGISSRVLRAKDASAVTKVPAAV